MTPNQEKSTKARSEKDSQEKPPADVKGGVLDGFPQRLETWRIKFDRFGWDVLGIILLAAALISLLGLLGLTKGALTAIWVNFLNRWLGWGSYLISAAFILSSWMIFRKHASQQRKISIGRIIALEVLAFCVISFLSVLGGHSLDRAEKGLDGGLIGWGIAELFHRVLPISWVGILSAIVAMLLLLYVSGVFGQIFKRLEVWAKRVADEPEMRLPERADMKPGSDFIPGNYHPEGSSEGVPLDDENGVSKNGRSEHLPPLDILKSDQISTYNEDNIHETAAHIERTLAEFGIPARVVGFRVGPTVTQFAVEPGYIEKPSPDGEMVRHKVRVSQISALSKDLTLALSAERLRIEAPVPGQSFVGIEVPNPKSTIVGLRSVLESEEFQKMDSSLGFALGKDVSGKPVIADLARMPHILIAGTTGSGKSVCIAAITVCLAMNNSPEELKLVMLDPKMVELMRFNGLKHLLGKVETEPERILVVLKWALKEMDRRYRLLETARAKNIDTYNNKPGRKREERLPKIVIMIDELADLMLSAPDQTEHSLVRLAQMARATGIHLVLATQRPSTDVVTGLIKANFPARISFNVASSIDSRVILDGTGAETLLGKGDMLFLNPEKGKPTRAQGVIVSDDEIDKVIRFWQENGEPALPGAPWEELVYEEQEQDGADRLVEEAIGIVRKTQHASASMLQRRLRIGYPRAARLIDELEELGVVGPSQGGGKEREVLIGREDDDSDEFDPGSDGGDPTDDADVNEY